MEKTAIFTCWYHDCGRKTWEKMMPFVMAVLANQHRYPFLFWTGTSYFYKVGSLQRLGYVFRMPPVLYFAASLEDLRWQETVYSQLLLEGLDEDGRADIVMFQAVCLQPTWCQNSCSVHHRQTPSPSWCQAISVCFFQSCRRLLRLDQVWSRISGESAPSEAIFKRWLS